MKIFFILAALFTLANYTAIAQSPNVQDAISVQRAEYLVRTLSSDMFLGRKAFTPSVKKAAKFISKQFDAAGLEPLEQENSYLQRFSVFTLHPDKKSLVLNDNKVREAFYFVTTHHKTINWKGFTGIDVRHISKKDNFKTSFSAISDASENRIVLVDKSHQRIFERYSAYFSGPDRNMQLNEGGSTLFVLTDATEVNNGSFSFSQTVEKQQAANVAGKITGTSKKDEYVIFSAHYDHIGVIEPVDEDSIANGADDDASGTTAVIMLAEYFKKLGAPERTLIFAAFTAEEMGGYGSRYFSRQLDPDKVVAMFNIEMIGKPSKFGPKTAFLTGFDKTDMGRILQANLEGTPYRIYPDPYPRQNLFFRSDNTTLARLGVPAHTISSDQIDKDPYYHTVDDEPATLDMEHLTHMIRAVALSSGSIVSGSDTPSRLDPLLLN